MDKKRGIINVTVAITFKIFLLVANIVLRRCIIRCIGNDINGLNSLYASILGFLAVAELGVGTAITFCMYKPIVEGDNDKVAALYRLFTKLYLIIGAIILVSGCALMPALPYLAKDYESTGVNLYLTFGLMLVSVVLSYAFSAKTSLINAYKNNYITTIISSGGLLLQYVVQIVVVVLTRDFVWFLSCHVVIVILQWGATELAARLKHSDILRNKQRIDTATKKDVSKNVGAMFMHKIGTVLVNTADSIIISAFIGVSMLGKYSNYSIIVTSMTSVLALCFTPLTSVIGHMFVSDDRSKAKDYFEFFHTFNFVLGLIFFLGYYAVVDNFVTILFKGDLELAKSISLVITLNYFIQFMRQATLLFRDATGTFYNDRWKSLVEGVVNIVLSVLFVLIFPKEYNVVGVIVATIITNVFICHIVEPHVLHKHALKISTKKYYVRNYAYIAIFSAALVALHFAMLSRDNQWIEMFANGGISLAFSIPLAMVVILCSKNFRHYSKSYITRLKNRKRAVPAAESLSGAETVGSEEIALEEVAGNFDLAQESGSVVVEEVPLRESRDGACGEEIFQNEEQKATINKDEKKQDE